MEEEKMIDQTELAQSIADKIPYEFMDYFLVKPLAPVMVKKEFSKPVSNGESEDKNGVVAEDFNDVETEVKEVESDYRKAIVLKRPSYYDKDDIKIGSVVIFREIAGLRFDLLKDSRLLRLFDILGVEK